MERKAEIGILGGTGLQGLPGMDEHDRVEVETPFGAPSARYILGTLGGHRVAFLSRHGEGHRLSPSELNFRANLYGFKSLGVERLLSASAVGSLRPEIRPLEVVIPDQFLDRTRHRQDSFYGGGVVVHVGLADPVCPDLRRLLVAAARDEEVPHHDGGTYVCIEGPQFSTRAESNLYRAWGGHVIGMTNVTEARLAREAEICYGTLALVTDYDCWKTDEPPVSVEAVIDHLRRNAETARRLLARAVSGLRDIRRCGCAGALKDAILTPRERIPAGTRERLGLLLGRYLEEG